MVLSFAWGLAPASARADVHLAALGGCTVSDVTWKRRIELVLLESTFHPSRIEETVSCCVYPVKPSRVPRLLLRELLVHVASRVLRQNESILTTPRATVHSAKTDRPPMFWRVELTACFPCDGTPVVRCMHITALLDAKHVERSVVLSALDAGVVPAEESISFGVLPFNAQTAELNLMPS